MYSTHAPSEGHLARLAAVDRAIAPVVVRSEAEAVAQCRDAEVILGHRYLRQALPHAEELQWVQSTAGGVDRLPVATLATRGVLLTRMSIAAGTIARHALTLAWALSRQLPEWLARQARGQWDPDAVWPPTPRRALVLGAGAIGAALARLLRREGIHVTGVRRRAVEATPDFDALIAGGDWRALLPTVDWCFLALPCSGETLGLFDEAALRSLPRHAIVVNVGRGETLDTAALQKVLRDGWLAGAALDVVAPAPAGPADPLWQTPRLVITPYVASHSRERPESIERFCEEQVGRFVRGEPLRDLVDLEPRGTPVSTGIAG
jgi:phosphoglycerate dehydrogenase-like enzyme